MEAPNGPDDTSWWDELIGGSRNKQSQVPPPPKPSPPPVDQSAWEKSVEQAKVSDSLGPVHDLGLIIFNERGHTRTDRTRMSRSTLLARRLLTPSLMPTKHTASVA